MLKINNFIFSLCFVLSSCSIGTEGYQKAQINEFYIASGVIKYFLSELPDWANVSYSGNCKRSDSVKMLDFGKVQKSFNFSYFESTQVQYIFNDKYKKLKRNNKTNYIPLKDEENLFHQSIESVNAKLYAFKKPKYKRVNVIWLDPFFSSPAKLKKFIQRSDISKGYPVFTSLCYNQPSMVEFINKTIGDKNAYSYIPVDMLSPFNVKGSKLNFIGIDLENIFTKKQKIYLYLPKGENPKEFFGNTRKIYY